MTDLQKRLDRYINGENSDPLAIGMICELRAHLKASNKANEFYDRCLHARAKDYYEVIKRVQQLELKINPQTAGE